MAPARALFEVKGVTHKVANEYHIEELQSTDNNQEQHEAVKQLGTLCSLFNVAVPYSLQDVLGVVGGL